MLGEDHPNTAVAIFYLGVIYFKQGKLGEAEPLLAKSKEMIRRTLGERHPSTVLLTSMLGRIYFNQAKFAQAEPLYFDMLEAQRRSSGEEQPETLTLMSALARIYRMQGKYAQAETLLSKALAVRRRAPDPKNLSTTNSKVALARVWLLQRKYEASESLLREAINDYEKLPDRWERYLVQSMLGESLAGQRKYPEAEPLLLSGYQGIVKREGAIPEDDRVEVETALDQIGQLYQDWGKAEQAAEWRAKLETRRTWQKKIF